MICLFVLCGTTPHNIMFVENLKEFPVFETGRKIRNSDSNPNGINTNFVEIKDDIVNVRTYERGVEDEVFACGTGATSVAIACSYLNKIKSNICHIKMPGGNLTVEFEKRKWLIPKHLPHRPRRIRIQRRNKIKKLITVQKTKFLRHTI